MMEKYFLPMFGHKWHKMSAPMEADILVLKRIYFFSTSLPTFKWFAHSMMDMNGNTPRFQREWHKMAAPTIIVSVYKTQFFPSIKRSELLEINSEIINKYIFTNTLKNVCIF